MPVPTNEVTMGRQFEVAENFELTLVGAGGAQNLFDITGGPIYLQRLTGIVTTEIDAAGTVIANFRINPTFGAAPGTEVDMCLAAGGLDIDTLLPDSQITITGGVAAAAVATITGVVVAPSFMTNHQILAEGVLELFTVGATIVGAVTWTIVYRPLVEGVSVVAS